MRKHWLAWVGYIIAAVSLAANGWLGQKNSDFPEIYQVREVIDGDTIVVEEGLKIRLNNLNAPEVDACGGVEAKNLLESSILNKKVGIQIIGADSYQRPLVIIYQDGSIVNQTLLESGWVYYTSTGHASDIKKEMLNTTRAAKERKNGIFSSKCTQLTNEQEPNCSIKGNVNQTNKRKVYHFPGCQQYESIPVELYLEDQWFCTEAEARKAGFTKSSQCHDKKFVTVK